MYHTHSSRRVTIEEDIAYECLRHLGDILVAIITGHYEDEETSQSLSAVKWGLTRVSNLLGRTFLLLGLDDRSHATFS